MKKVIDIELTGVKAAGFSLAASESENYFNCREVLFEEREPDVLRVRHEIAKKKEAAKLESTALMIGLSGFAAMVIAFLAFLL